MLKALYIICPTCHVHLLYFSQLAWEHFREATIRNGTSLNHTDKTLHCLQSGTRFTHEWVEEMYVTSAARTRTQGQVSATRPRRQQQSSSHFSKSTLGQIIFAWNYQVNTTVTVDILFDWIISITRASCGIGYINTLGFVFQIDWKKDKISTSIKLSSLCSE